MTKPLPRRRFLQLTGGVGAWAALAGCGGEKEEEFATENAKVKLPSYVPYTGIKADLPASAPGMVPAYLHYPDQAKQTLRTPGKALDQVAAATITFEPAPPPADSNSYWQAVNEQLGTELDLQLVPSADYDSKFSTMVASGGLPDLLYFAASGVRDQPEMLQSLFTDLTDYVSGDAINDYPYLANIPTESWQSMIFAGGIYGVPLPRPVLGSIMFLRLDRLRTTGMSAQPKTWAEFAELCKALTDDSTSHWATASAGNILPFVAASTGASNGWSEEGGKFTSANVMDEMKQAVGLIADLVKDGVIHPDGFGATGTQPRTWMSAGRVSLLYDGYIGWPAFMLDWGEEIDGVVPPLFDGGGLRQFAGPTSLGMTALKKADGERVKQLLSVLNWLAAPFGTAEYLFRKYGVEGEHYDWKNGTPVRTDKGLAEIKLSLQYITDAPYVISPNKEELVQRQYDFEKRAVPTVVRNPATGLFSDTAIAKGADLGSILEDAQLKIWKGDEPLSSWDDAVAEWRKSGGDQVRDEYQKALQEQGPA